MDRILTRRPQEAHVGSVQAIIAGMSARSVKNIETARSAEKQDMSQKPAEAM
jgi:hypothetical protein